jgi:hypothetical protein
MKLSIACYTNDPAYRVVAALKPLRAVADEIVIAVDSRVDPALLGEYVAATDRVIRFEFNGANRCKAWLHTQCAGDWVLLLDGDELVSTQLLDHLPELIASRDVLQYQLPRRWLYPDARHWLNELPWWPDYQNRLVRNDGTLWFPGTKRTGAANAYPCRYLEWPIYHLSFLALSLDERIARAIRYEAEDPGRTAPGGGPFNEAYYLPERYARLEPVRVDARDQEAIDNVLSARPARSRANYSARLADTAEIDRYYNGRVPNSDAYRAAITLIERDHHMFPGELRHIHVRVANLGSERWPAGAEQSPLIRAAYHWKRDDGRVYLYDGIRSQLPCRLDPGCSTVVAVLVQAPEEPGDFVLEIDLVHEHVRWFECPVRIEMRIAA